MRKVIKYIKWGFANLWRQQKLRERLGMGREWGGVSKGTEDHTRELPHVEGNGKAKCFNLVNKDLRENEVEGNRV